MLNDNLDKLYLTDNVQTGEGDDEEPSVLGQEPSVFGLPLLQ